MKITFVVPDSMAAVRGGMKRIAEYASRLAKRGHNVFILSPDREIPEWLEPYSGTYRLADINKGYRDFETDIAIATGGRAGRRMGRMRKAKVKAYSVVMLESLNKPTEKHGKKIDRDKFLSDPYDQNWLYYSNSSWMSEVVEKNFGQKCHLILAPSHERMKPSESFKPEDKLWILGYGNGDWKGGSRTAEAVALARKSLPNLEMIHYSQKSIPKPRRVIVKHWPCPNQDLLPRIYSSADLFVHSSRFEGFANTCMESISCGTPVLSYNTPGIEDIVIQGKTGQIVDGYHDREFNINAMARCIVRTLKDQDLMQKMQKRCLDHAATFHWEKTLSQLESIFVERLYN